MTFRIGLDVLRINWRFWFLVPGRMYEMQDDLSIPWCWVMLCYIFFVCRLLLKTLSCLFCLGFWLSYYVLGVSF